MENTIRFRDGERTLPDHLVLRLSGLDTRRMTYDEAMDAANGREFADYVNGAQQKMVRDHLKGNF
jgi:tRNA(His) 5'-end guanylyltransferase